MPASMIVRRIGGSSFPAIGFGSMGIGGKTYGNFVSSENEPRFKVLDRLLELGCTHWDTSNIYGDSEELIGNWFKRTGKRDQIFLATKKLGVDVIDLYYIHRIDPKTPIEVTMNFLAELVKAGKIRYIGLSQPSPATLRRAHKVHPIAAIQVEYSPFERSIEKQGHLLETARELGIAIVAYSPLGKGLITGQITSHSEFSDSDLRKQIPKYSQENFPKILKLVDAFKQIGKAHNATSGQVALAYLLEQGDDIIPIPGSQRIEYIEENIGAGQIKLTTEEIQTLRKLVDETEVIGAQYPPVFQAMLYADTPELP
ncbi:aldo/keto reductase family protein [Rhizoctonia solani]|uniref:Aldo/keto reductase family protein n=1 Tax=Rhizoctonia solani TaxID=456999 RepID=A0A8H8SWM8_9AGAM|nr:aldo/keto reductase family protein [Rhizoctonia solani]QRW20709.1 aldo/keto reductase family protein [Rhizoctonia solani]